MPITELVFMTAKSDPQTRKELNIKLPEVLREVFSKAPNLESLYIGSNLEATENESNQDGICLLLEWQDISSFDSFLASTEFAAFKSSMLPYFAGPPDIQLYESRDQNPDKIGVDSPYLHIMKSYSKAADAQSSQHDRANVVDRWKAFVDQCRLVSNVNRSLDSSFNGFGLRKDNGAFVGATLWKDIESIDVTLNDRDVKQHLKQLQEVLGTSDWVHFDLKIDQVALVR